MIVRASKSEISRLKIQAGFVAILSLKAEKFRQDFDAVV